MKTIKISNQSILFGGENQRTGIVYTLGNNGELIFSHFESEETKSLLCFVESGLPNIICGLMPWIYEKDGATCSEVLDRLIESNPLQISKEISGLFYQNILVKLLSGVIEYQIAEDGSIIPNIEFAEILYGDYQLNAYPIQLHNPSVLLPYCSFEVSDDLLQDENTKLLRIIIKYKDKTAPTRLGSDLNRIMCMADINNTELFDTLTSMKIRLFDKYSEQVSYFGETAIDMVNKQVY